MKDRLAQLATQLKTSWTKLPAAAKVGLAVFGAGLLAVCVWLIANAGEGPYEPLYDQPVELARAAQIREQLETGGVPYRVASDGSILVPSDRKLELRMQMAQEGLHPTTSTGFELFDEQRIGASDFEQRVNFQRALEGELARTIRTLRAVDTVRVHLNLPRRSLFREEEVEPSASVVMGLKRGALLGRKQVVGIQELVARSVERLQPERVAVLDERGRMLSRDREDETGTGALDYQRRYERDLEARVEDILERTLGEEHAVVRVYAEFDFTRTEEMQERYDPDRSVIRSEQLVRESSGGLTDGTAGIPGVRSNLPGGPGPEKTTGGSVSRRQSETRNYEVDKVVRRVVAPVARLKRQSVAVLVDGRWEEPSGDEGSGDGASGEAGERTFVPRDPAELERLASLVKRAVGYDPDRGDSVDVQSMPFVSGDETEGTSPPETAPAAPGWPPWATWAAAALAALLILGLVAAIAVRRRRRRQAESRPRTVRELEAQLEGAESAELEPGAGAAKSALPGKVSDDDAGEEIRREALNLAAQDASSAARVIRSWLAEDPPKADRVGRAA